MTDTLIPTDTAQPTISLQVMVRPSWSVLFAKGYALLGRDYPELRRSYLKVPWSRFYEHPHSIVALNVERRLPGEDQQPVARGMAAKIDQDVDAIGSD